jgi:hypothetical protein
MKFMLFLSSRRFQSFSSIKGTIYIFHVLRIDQIDENRFIISSYASSNSAEKNVPLHNTVHYE